MATQRIYLDHAATTPVRPEVREAMLPFLGDEAFGNPSSPHWFGRMARAGLEAARKRVADALGVEVRDVLFTSGGTEADNLAILGCAMSACGGMDLARAHIVATPIEHKAVLAALHEAELYGAKTTLLPVDTRGVVDLDALDKVLSGTPKPTVVSVMWVNNETGVIQPAEEIAGLCAAAGVPFHSDAVQAFGKVPMRLDQAPGVTFCSISAHKIGGPKGVGAIVVQGRKGLHPLMHGGGQQGGLRPGTENVPGAVALGVAAQMAAEEQPATLARLAAIRDAVEAELKKRVSDLVIHGEGAKRGPNILHMSAPGTDSEAMLMHLDLAGLACASGSACQTGSVEPSHVLSGMGTPKDIAIAAVRMSFGSLSSQDQVPRIADAFDQVVTKVRALRAVLARA
ncbi:MAG: cysteine desulfurase family protein [Gemmatimonadales bacterium]